MIITTTNSFDDMNIKDYLGIVFGEVTSGVDFTRDFAVSVRNFIGGRSGSYEKELIQARETAISEMAERAMELGADAVVGVKVDCEPLSTGSNGGVMITVCASGTAVVLE